MIDILTQTKWAKIALGALLGAAAGFGYYKLVGCSSGTCPITSNPFISTIYGALAGIMMTI